MIERKQRMHALLGVEVHVVVDRPIGYDHNGIIYPINYGYIPGLLGGDGEEQDTYILGVEEPLEEFHGRVIGIVFREDDVEDKLVTAPEGMAFHQAQIGEIVHFQEQFFRTDVDSLLRQSCGVMAFRHGEQGIEILICYEDHPKHWSLPKGHMEPFETEVQTAQRELWEETGFRPELLPIPPAAEEFERRPGVTKRIVYFTAEVSGEPRPRPGEISHFRWIRPDQLEEYLPSRTVEVCRQLLARISEAHSSF